MFARLAGSGGVTRFGSGHTLRKKGGFAASLFLSAAGETFRTDGAVFPPCQYSRNILEKGTSPTGADAPFPRKEKTAMSRSKRKSSERRKAPSAGTPAAVSPAVCNEAASLTPDNATDAPCNSAPLPLPGDIPPSAANRRGGVSGLTCVLCCGICLLGGMFLGNLLPHALDRQEDAASRTVASQPAPAASKADAGAPPSDPAPAAAAAVQEKAMQAAPPVNASREALEHIGHLEKRLAANPQDVDGWTELGNAYFDTHQPLKAINAYERSLALRPGDPNVLTDLGIMYRESGQLGQALECFDRAMRADPAHENARFNKGVILLFDLHQHAEAKAVWQELLRMNPRATAPDGTALRTLIEQCDKPLP